MVAIHHHNRYYSYQQVLRTGLFLTHAAVWEHLADIATPDDTQDDTYGDALDDAFPTQWLERFQ